MHAAVAVVLPVLAGDLHDAFFHLRTCLQFRDKAAAHGDRRGIAFRSHQSINGLVRVFLQGGRRHPARFGDGSLIAAPQRVQPSEAFLPLLGGHVIAGELLGVRLELAGAEDVHVDG